MPEWKTVDIMRMTSGNFGTPATIGHSAADTPKSMIIKKIVGDQD